MVRVQCPVKNFHGRFLLIYQWQNLYVVCNCPARFSAVEHLINPWNLNSWSSVVNIHDFLSSVGTFSERRWLGMVNDSLSVSRKGFILKNATHIKYGSFTMYKCVNCSCPLFLSSPQVVPYLYCCRMSCHLLCCWGAEVSSRTVASHKEGKCKEAAVCFRLQGENRRRPWRR